MIGSTNAGSTIKTTLAVTVVDSSSSGYQSGRTITITNGVNTQTATTDSNGQATFNIRSIGTYTISSDVPSGATANTATVTAELGGSYTATITLSVTTISVTVTDASSSGYQEGRIISATNGTETVTGTTDGTGAVSLHLTGTGTYTVSCTNVPTGGSMNTVTVSVQTGGSYTAAITISFGWVFGMSFNSTTFQTDPTGCFVYTDDLVGKTPLANTGTSLARASNYASSYWCWNDDGTSSNPLLKGCFFATFTSSGVLHEKLNPNDLTQKIATWNGTDWTSASGSSSIASEDTMFCIPTVYSSRSSSKLLLSSKSSEGTAYAHTIGGHTYQYLAIGVYLSSDDGSKCWSKSGVQAKGSQTRADFRSHSTAKTVQNGHAMVWNYHQYALMRDLVFFTAKSFDGQRKIGMGGHSYSTRQTGGCNSMSPIAGNVSGTSDHMMCYIEDFWGCQYQFIDDFYGNSGTYYVGQNAVPTDNTSNKTSITGFAAQGFVTGILTGDISWGLGTNSSGDNSKGLCDYQYYSTSTDRLGLVGGDSGDASNGYAGPSYLHADSSLSDSYGDYGARLAFVFDVDSASTLGSYDITLSVDGSGNLAVTGVENTIKSTSKDAMNEEWSENGTGPFGSFYAAFDPADGNKLVCRLDPNDLTKDIEGNQVTNFGNYNIMWVLPTVYWYVDTGGALHLTDNPTQGVAYAHTIDGHVYRYVAIGVYEASMADGNGNHTDEYNKDTTKLVSFSGQTPTASKTRPQFRDIADNYTMDSTLGNDSKSMLWNFYQWELYKYCSYAVMGGFNSQSLVGQGYTNSANTSSINTGATDNSGPYAGGTDEESAKCFIENAWGGLWNFVDGIVVDGKKGFWISQKSNASDDDIKKEVEVGVIIEGEVKKDILPASGWALAPFTDDARYWGYGKTNGGSATSGLCDYIYTASDTDRVLFVGGGWYDGSAAGVSSANSTRALSYSGGIIGARLAFVFDL